jgi:hypothetical protein
LTCNGGFEVLTAVVMNVAIPKKCQFTYRLHGVISPKVATFKNDVNEIKMG